MEATGSLLGSKVKEKSEAIGNEDQERSDLDIVVEGEEGYDLAEMGRGQE
jgi:predicted nucleotidyltransferase